MLEPLGRIRLTLPAIYDRDLRVGGNRIARVTADAQTVEGVLRDSEYEGWFQLEIGASAPNGSILLSVKKNPSLPPGDLFCLSVKKVTNPLDITSETSLAWLRHELLDVHLSPQQVCERWKGAFRFLEQNEASSELGLRTPQLGALHALAAYFSVSKTLEPATVVLPTGTGKTETMLALLVYRGLPKVLVLVPSDILRAQIANKFFTLGHLAKLGVIPPNTPSPAVAVITKGMQSVEEAEQILHNSNVIVATASILNASREAALGHLCRGVSDLLVDEAHHVTARTWSSVKEHFLSKRIAQFTATPFRNDGNPLGGRVIYNFSMGDAQAAGYFRHIKLIAIEEYRLDSADESIAKAAVTQLKTDLADGLDHLLMARVEEKSRAADLLPIYARLAPDMKPLVVHSGLPPAEVKAAIAAIRARESKIVICVNMLGEGFDLSSLKIAAIHDSHKSLAITLQFIGRFTRSDKDVGDASVVVNIAEPEVERGLQKLYAQDADWDSVLRRLSENQIEREVWLHDVITGLKQRGDLHKQISLWNLRPGFSAVLFRSESQDWKPERFSELLPTGTKYWSAINEKEKVLVVLAIQHATVKWGRFSELHDTMLMLLVAHWDEKRKALFVYSSDYDWFRVYKASELIMGAPCELLSGPQVFNVFNGLEYPLVRNLGASQVGAISFTQYFGPNVTEGLTRIEAAESQLSNLAGLGYDDGEKVLWGCSEKKGKIWSAASGSIADWIFWARVAWDKVTDGDVDASNITRDFLRPKRLASRYPEHVIAVFWGEHIQSEDEDRVVILFGDDPIPAYFVELKVVAQDTPGPINIAVSSDEHESIYSFSIDSTLPVGFAYQLLSGRPLKVRKGSRAELPIEEYLLVDPWILQYANSSYSYNCFLIELPQTFGAFPKDDIESWKWDGIDIRKESMGKELQQDSIQWRAYEQIKDRYDVIINDDGKGEAADLVGLRVVGDVIHLALVHCKYSAKDMPGRRLGDLYEVCGQAQKSIRWKHGGIGRLYSHIKPRQAAWASTGQSRFLKGTLGDLSNIKRRARTATIKLHVVVVQPGMHKELVTDEMQRVLGATAVYLKKTALADFSVIGAAG
jgi:superfamily II DNA or RNA helicase